MGKTLPEKVWEQHLVHSAPDEPDLLYIDLHLVHEVTSPQAFDGLRLNGRTVRRPDLTIATEDHNVPTENIDQPIADPISAKQIDTLRANTAEFGITNFPMGDPNQGIVHVIGPEQGRTLPGMTIVCGDSHTATHGAFGALAFGIGTSEVEHVLATQSLPQQRPKWMSVTVEGDLQPGVTAKDVILAILGEIGTGGGIGHVIEYRGSAIRALSMEGRMTVCNMSIEAGAKAGLIAPDNTTFEYLQGRENAPTGDAWDAAVADWSMLHSDDDAMWDKEVVLDATAIRPHVTWGTNPGQVAPIDSIVPSPDDYDNPTTKETVGPGAGVHGPRTRDAAARCRCRHGVHRFVHQQPHRGPPRGCRRDGRPDGHRSTRDGGAGQPRREGPGDRRGTRPGVHRRRRRLARARLLDVPGDEPGQTRSGRASGEHQQPQLRGTSGPRWSDPPRVARRGRCNRSEGHVLYTCRPGRSRIMKAVQVITGTGVPLKRSDVDTDQIIPADWLKRVERTGFEKGLFSTWRDDRDFVLNDERYSQANILVAGPAFGVGSSREHAVWAIQQYGFDAVIAPSFSDIFRNNCTKNGLAPVIVPESTVEAIWAAIEADARHPDRRRHGTAESRGSGRRHRRELPDGSTDAAPVPQRARRRRYHTHPRRGDRHLRGQSPDLARLSSRRLGAAPPDPRIHRIHRVGSRPTTARNFDTGSAPSPASTGSPIRPYSRSVGASCSIVTSADAATSGLQ